MNTAFLIKYLSGDCTAEEQVKVENWLKESSENRLYLDHVQKIWSVQPKDEFKPDANKAWHKMESRLTGIETFLPEREASKSHSEKFYENHKKDRASVNTLIFTIAAIFIITIGVLFIFKYPVVSSPEKMTVKKEIAREVKTEKGQRTTFRLVDGSRVTLNAASKIIIPPSFNAKNRELYLEGEAYFEVQADKKHPFIVYSKNTFTRVLGTKFTILAYDKNDKILTAVEEGRVAFGRNDSLSANYNELTKNEVAELYSDGRSKVYYKEDLDEYLGWKDGKLVFKNARFKEVVDKLERWYNIQIVAPDSLIEYRNLTASFKDEPMSEVLKVVSMSLHLSYKKNGREIVFKNKQMKDN